MSQVRTPPQTPYVGSEPKLPGQPIAQLHRSHQSPVMRQSGMSLSVCIATRRCGSHNTVLREITQTYGNFATAPSHIAHDSTSEALETIGAKYVQCSPFVRRPRSTSVP